MNTILQLYLLDLIYSQQKVYSFYENQCFEAVDGKKRMKKIEDLKEINVKESKGIFANLLKYFSNTIKMFDSEEDIQEFNSLRWYYLSTDQKSSNLNLKIKR